MQKNNRLAETELKIHTVFLKCLRPIINHHIRASKPFEPIVVKRYTFLIHFWSNGMHFCIFGYGLGQLGGWLAGGLAGLGWLGSWQAGWLGWLVGWLAGWLAGWLVPGMEH